MLRQKIKAELEKMVRVAHFGAARHMETGLDGLVQRTWLRKARQFGVSRERRASEVFDLESTRKRAVLREGL